MSFLNINTEGSSSTLRDHNATLNFIRVMVHVHAHKIGTSSLCMQTQGMLSIYTEVCAKLVLLLVVETWNQKRHGIISAWYY